MEGQAMSYQTDLRNKVNDQIIAAMRKGQMPWMKPWSSAKNTGFPVNAVSGKLYRGVNVLLLHLAGHSSKFWATYRQWQALGGQVRKGERGTRIIFWKPITKTKIKGDGEEESKTFPLLKEYVVFCADQCDGAEHFQVQPSDSNGVVDFEPAERVIAATGWDIRHQAGDKAFYARPPQDFIVLPPKAQFAEGRFGMAGYYCTLFHELMHASEHRLGWVGSYSLNELRAELGACYLAAEVGIPAPEGLENHARYLDHWIREMGADSRVIFQIASAASKGADFILAFSRQRQPEEEAVLSRIDSYGP
jgi:antirestriction protein ArdC